MALTGINDYLASKEAREEYIRKHSGGFLTRGESTLNLASIMVVLMDLISTVGAMEGQTAESRKLFQKCIEGTRDLHKMLILNSGAPHEQIKILLKEAGHSTGEGDE